MAASLQDVMPYAAERVILIVRRHLHLAKHGEFDGNVIVIVANAIIEDLGLDDTVATSYPFARLLL